MAPSIMQDVVAYVYCSDAQHNARAAITSRLQDNGAKVVPRLTKEVTHIIFERRRSQRPSDKEAEAADIHEMYRKVELYEYPPLIVNPLWVDQSISEKRRLIEHRFTVARPKANLITKAPGSTGAATKRKRGPVAAAAPRPAVDLELDPLDPIFSSSQQIQGEGGAAAGGGGADGEVSSPKRKRTRQRRRTGDPGTLAAEVMTLPALPAAGAETQAVADILAIDLHERNLDDDDDDDLDTPLNVRFARKSLGGGSSAEGAAGASGSGGLGAGQRQQQVGRSRLARASGPAPKEHQHQQAEEDEIEDVPTQEDHKQQQQQQRPGSGRAGSAQGVAQRFSVRVLQAQIERPVLLHKGTPLQGAMPATTVKKKPSSIPIPGIQRVDSPWNVAPGAAPPTSQPTQPTPTDAHIHQGSMPPSFKAGLGRTSAAAAVAGGRGAKHTPAAGGGPVGDLPSPWTSLRPWDLKNAKNRDSTPRLVHAVGPTPEEEEEEQQEHDDDDVGGDDVDQGAEEYDDENADLGNNDDGEEGAGKKQKGTGKKAGKKASVKENSQDSLGPGPTHGCIAVTSVGSGMQDLAKAAVRRLRGLRMCAQGREESVTHLVIGQERRTLKVLLAITNGAWLLSPEWVTASLEAGRWLPESRFPATVKFTAAADKAREVLEVPDATLPLHEYQAIAIHAWKASSKGDAPSVPALKRLVTALGGSTVPLQQCQVCVMAGGQGKMPARVPEGAVVVDEKWLLEAAERFEAPELKEYEIV